MDERWKGLPRERLEDALVGRKNYLARMREDLQRVEDSITWWREHSFDGPLEGDEEFAITYRRLVKDAEERITAMDAFLQAPAGAGDQ